MTDFDPTCPYGIVQKGKEFFPQFEGKDIPSQTKEGPKKFGNLEGVKKYLRKILSYRVKLSTEHFRKYNVPLNGMNPHEHDWLSSVDSMVPQVVAYDPVPVKKEVVPQRTAMLMKYIVVQSEDEHGNIHELPIMFPYSLVHKAMKECTWRSLIESDHRFISCVGAGFCSLGTDKLGGLIVCFGESESLGIESRGELDTAAFARCARGESYTVVEKYNASV